MTKETRTCWELEEDIEDCFGRGCGRVIRKTTERMNESGRGVNLAPRLRLVPWVIMRGALPPHTPSIRDLVLNQAQGQIHL